MIALDEFATLLAAESDPKKKLQSLCEIMVSSFAQPSHKGWEWRVISREALSPSHEINELRKSQLIPKILILRDLVSELIQLPPEHPATIQGCLHIIAPIVLLQVGDWSAIGQALPGFQIEYSNREEIAKRFYAFISGGLQALAKNAQQ
jgi:TetR/AcrR family transcriptional regulator, regulator of cefoperazone and chloramphenicol sensitivity